MDRPWNDANDIHSKTPCWVTTCLFPFVTSILKKLLKRKTNIILTYILVDFVKHYIKYDVGFNFFLQASVSMKRLQKFVSADELDPNSVDRTSNLGPAISIVDGVFAWDNDGEPTLQELVVFNLFICNQIRFRFNLLLLVLVSTSIYREVHLWLLLVK